MENENIDNKYIYIVHAKNEGGIFQPYSTREGAGAASIKLSHLRPEWNIMIDKRIIDDTEFWENGHLGGEYVLPFKRIKRCFDKEFILLIYFSLLAFLWFKI